MKPLDHYAVTLLRRDLTDEQAIAEAIPAIERCFPAMDAEWYAMLAADLIRGNRAWLRDQDVAV
jgi:hypothetical protein